MDGSAEFTSACAEKEVEAAIIEKAGTALQCSQTTTENVARKSKLNPYAKEFIPFPVFQLPASEQSEKRHANKQASKAIEIVPPDKTLSQKATGGNCTIEAKPSPQHQPKPNSGTSIFNVISKLNMSPLEQLLNEFTDRNRQLVMIQIHIDNTCDISIELISRETENNIIRTTAHDMNSPDTVKIILDDSATLESKSYNTLVAKFFRGLSDVINENIEQQPCDKRDQDTEEEIAYDTTTERIELKNMNIPSHYLTKNNHESIVQDAIGALCKKLNISECEMNLNVTTTTTKDINDDGHDLKQTTSVLDNAKSSMSSLKFTDSHDSFVLSDASGKMMYKFECTDGYELHVNQLSRSESILSGYKSCILEVPPTTPAISNTELSLRATNQTAKAKQPKRKSGLGGTIRKTCRAVLASTFKRDTTKDCSTTPACRIAAGCSRLRGGGTGTARKSPTQHRQLITEHLRLSKPAPTRTIVRSIKTRDMTFEHNNNMKKTIRRNLSLQEDKSISKSSTDKTFSNSGSVPKALNYKTNALTKAKEKRLLSLAKSPRGVGAATGPLRQSDAKKMAAQWKV